MEVVFRLISKAKATHTIKEITKDGDSFTNPSKGFKINSKGKVYTDAIYELPAGIYVVTISTKDKSDSNIKIMIHN